MSTPCENPWDVVKKGDVVLIENEGSQMSLRGIVQSASNAHGWVSLRGLSASFRRDGGWMLTIIMRPLPTEPGLYVLELPVGEDDGSSEWSTDRQQFYYLNNAGHWISLGWDAPTIDDANRLVKWAPLPF